MLDDREWLDPEDAAKRMGLTLPELDDLIRRGAVRARRTGWGIEVEPAIVSRSVIPRSCAARIIRVASSSPRPRRAGSLSVSEYGQ